MNAEETWLVLSLICGLVSAIVASSKGRSAVWWFLVGATLTVLGVAFVALASDVKRLGFLEEELARLRRELGELRFEQAVTIGSHHSDSICASCHHFNHHFSVCAVFRREVREPVVVCREFVVGAESSGKGTEQSSRMAPEPPIPPISRSPARW